MAKIRKRKIQWQKSGSPGVVGYKLYWAEASPVDYDSESAMLGNVGEIVLPDGVPSFPLVKGAVEIGITAVNEIGNESDMTKASFPFQFAVPEAPADLTLGAAEGYFVSQSPPAPEASGAERKPSKSSC
jgi:hypothetical protein